MNRYNYEITGLYDDWCKITKDNIVYHSGSLIELIPSIEKELLIALNFGSDISYTYKLRSHKNLVIGVPLEAEYIQNKRVYTPVIFTKEEFEKLSSIVYVDEHLLSGVMEYNHQDLLEIWLCTLPERPLCENFSTLLKNEILDSVVAFSDDIMCVDKLINMLNDPLEIVSHNLQTSASVAIYVDSREITEWNALLFENGTYYLKLDEEFAIIQA